MPYLLILIGCLGLFLSIIGLYSVPIQQFDLSSVIWMNQHRHDILDHVNVFLSHIGGLPYMLLICGLWCLGLNWIKQYQHIFLISFGLLGAAIIGWWMKYLFDRPRPDALYALAETYGASFPSAHTIYATVLSCLVIFIFRKHDYARLIIFLACFWAFGMGISRVYLGAHFPTDVLAGWSIALIWMGILYRQFSPVLMSKK